MVSYEVIFSEKALKQLQKLDRQQAVLIFAWIEKHLQGCRDPRELGKPLTAAKRGYWRYRVGMYRVIASIEDSILKIEIVSVGHRKNIYNS